MGRETKRDFHNDLNAFATSFGEIVEELKRHRKKMLITMHRYLDGDAFGSAVALAYTLQRLGLGSTLLCVPFIPDKLKFLPASGRFSVLEAMDITGRGSREDFTGSLQDYFSSTINGYGALVVLDCAGLGQVPKEAWSLGLGLPHILNIDHHVGYRLEHPDKRVLNLVGDRSSTSEVLFYLMRAIGVDIDPEIAVPLYVGVVADLRKNDVSEESAGYPKDVVDSLRTIVDTTEDDIRRQIKDVFSLDAWEEHLLKTIINRIRFHGKLAYVTFNPHMVFSSKQATDSLHINRMPFHEFHIRLRRWLGQFRGRHQIIAIFDQILGKVSLYDLGKSGGIDLAGICGELGDGGGHLNRAGFSFHSAKSRLVDSGAIDRDLPEDRIIEKIVAFVGARLPEM